MTEVAGVIPFTAWEQAVFYVLLTVFVVYVLTWSSKRDKEQRDHYDDESSKSRAFEQAQSDKWQLFIETSNEQWRAFSEKQRIENNACMSDVNKGLTDLTRVTGQLVQTMNEMRTDIYQHDLQAKEIKHLVENAKPAPKPRATKTTQPEQ
jgi:hypothetical protein